MTQALNIICTDCKQQYAIDAALAARPAPDKGEGVNQYYLTCPHCQAETHAYYYAADIERRQRLVRIAAENMRKRQAGGDLARIENATRRYRQAQEDLRRKFEVLNPPRVEAEAQ